MKNWGLIVVDMQNDFLLPGAPMYVDLGLGIVPSIIDLIDVWQTSGGPVVHTRYIGDDRIRALLPKGSWAEMIGPPTCACVPGQERVYVDGTRRLGMDIIEAIARTHPDKIVDKVLYDAFIGSDLDGFLTEQGVDTLFLTGVVTDVCVADTARSAVHLGYRTSLVADACASDNTAKHLAELENFALNYGEVTFASRVLESLRY